MIFKRITFFFDFFVKHTYLRDMTFWIPTIATLFFLSLSLPSLGAVILWRRMTFFADSLAHACVLGVAASVIFKTDTHYGMIFVGFSYAILISLLEKQRFIALETGFAILSALFFSGGLIILYKSGARISFEDVLFGDVLLADKKTAILAATLFIITLMGLSKIFKTLVLVSLNPELATLHSPHKNIYEKLFLILLSLVVALSIPITGVLLLPALMILPAAAARFLSKSPKEMMILSALIGVLSSMIGLLVSYIFDTPTSPTIVLCSGLFLAIVPFVRMRRT